MFFKNYKEKVFVSLKSMSNKKKRSKVSLSYSDTAILLAAILAILGQKILGSPSPMNDYYKYILVSL